MRVSCKRKRYEKGFYYSVTVKFLKYLMPDFLLWGREDSNLQSQRERICLMYRIRTDDCKFLTYSGFHPYDFIRLSNIKFDLQFTL